MPSDPGVPSDPGLPTDEERYRHHLAVVVRSTPGAVYRIVSDITRTGEWSPVCRACWWDEPDAGAQVDAWFTGRNEANGDTWETRSRVVVADPGREFAFLVGGAFVRWGYTLEPVEGGTLLTESWHFLPAGRAMFHERYGERAPARAELRIRQAREGIPATLAAISAIAEAEAPFA